MKDELWIEVRDSLHLMNFEGSKDKEPTEEEVEKAVFGRGFIASNIMIDFDKMQKFWRTSGDIEKIKTIAIGQYSISQLNIDDFEIAGPYNNQKKIVCGGDLETILSTIFI